MLNVDQKKKVIRKYKVHKSDTGSSQVQIALITEKIKLLTKHLKKHKKDVHSRRGLLKMVQNRKKLLGFLKEQDPKSYAELAKQIGIKTTSQSIPAKKKK